MNVGAGIFSERIKEAKYICSVKNSIKLTGKNFNLIFHIFLKPNKYLIKNKNLETVDRL